MKNMRNLKLLIEYDGTNYAGWQVQNHLSSYKGKKAGQTVQGELQKALRKILRQPVKVIGAGRTDAGVHAKGYVANFNTTGGIACYSLHKALNTVLPRDIVVHEVEEVALDFHSRFGARSKTYRYSLRMGTSPQAIGRDYVYYYPFPLNIKNMLQAAAYLVGKHDFSSFGTSGSHKVDPHCTILRLSIKKTNSIITFDIEADYFIYRMVRNIVGTLLDVGRGKISPTDIKKILKAKDRRLAGQTVPSKGLCLTKIKY
jgi:tRNA pseudouridine38-40 synthase